MDEQLDNGCEDKRCQSGDKVSAMVTYVRDGEVAFDCLPCYLINQIGMSPLDVALEIE